MRTIDAAHAYLKQQDPETAVTKYALRRMVITNRIPHVNMGRKYLVDLDNLENYLAGSITPEPEDHHNTIRRIQR